MHPPTFHQDWRSASQMSNGEAVAARQREQLLQSLAVSAPALPADSDAAPDKDSASIVRADSSGSWVAAEAERHTNTPVTGDSGAPSAAGGATPLQVGATLKGRPPATLHHCISDTHVGQYE